MRIRPTPGSVCTRGALAIVLSMGMWLAPAVGSAEPYRLRADAFASSTPAVGLVALSSEVHEGSLFDAEALVWTGTELDSGDGTEARGEALIASVRARHPSGRGEVRVGRMMYSTGAVRPLHMDGVVLIARAPFGSSVEVFGGLPVLADYEGRSFDWTLGQRFSQRVEDVAVVGVSYWQQRDEGAIAHEELGMDALLTPLDWLDSAGSIALDLFRPGIVNARVSAAAHSRTGRVELFAGRRSPSRILPATSLFAAIGDVPSDRVGASALWRAAPRLDISATTTVESIAEELGGDQSLKATLRLDDDGRGQVALEGRRQGAPDASWTGIRGIVLWPLATQLHAATELELVVPDDSRGRGAVWPWGLLALGYRPMPTLEASAAVEAHASPESVSALGALVRISSVWEAPR